MTDPGVSLTNVTRRFGSRDREVTAVSDVTLQTRKGSFLSLLGPSGCGKSTLLRMMAGLDAPTTGRITVEGLSPHNRKITSSNDFAIASPLTPESRGPFEKPAPIRRSELVARMPRSYSWGWWDGDMFHILPF